MSKFKLVAPDGAPAVEREGKLIAKGEVVVIDENFGVRVTDIVSPTDRIKNESK